MTTIHFKQHSDINSAKEHHQRRVDEKAGEVRQRFARDWLLDEEYALAANQAQAFADSNYSGAAPETVQAWADAVGITGQQAADDILAMRTAYNAALENVRRIRLTAKKQVNNAKTAREAFDLAEDAVTSLDQIMPSQT